MFQLYRERPGLVWGMVLANIALTFWCLALDPVVNFDGVIYLSVAQLFLQGEFSAALDYYNWPFYPLIIALLAKLSTLSVETTAVVFNTAMAISLSLAFVCLVAQLSDHNRRIVLIAAMVILLFPSISKYRAFIIRDFGYLSCYLWSLYFLFRYCSTFSKIHLASWLVFAGLSSLFRFEGLIFVLIAPYFLFLFGATKIAHRRTIILTLSAVIATSCIALILWYINEKYTDSVEAARLAGKDISTLGDLFADKLQQRLGDKSLNAMNFGSLVIVNIAEVTGELIRRMAIFYLFFVAYAYIKSLALENLLKRRIWWIFVVTNVLLLIGFSITNHFFVSRYAMATVLTLMILAPFAIDRLIQQRKSATLRARVSLLVAIVLLSIVSLEGLDVRTKKRYIKSAGEWVATHAQAADNVYSNDRLAIYYADRGPRANMDVLYSSGILKQMFASNEIRKVHYLILVGQPKEPTIDRMRQSIIYHHGPPVKQFYGEQGHFAFVFKFKKSHG